jgi:hypothetical protein
VRAPLHPSYGSSVAHAGSRYRRLAGWKKFTCGCSPVRGPGSLKGSETRPEHTCGCQAFMKREEISAEGVPERESEWRTWLTSPRRWMGKLMHAFQQGRIHRAACIIRIQPTTCSQSVQVHYAGGPPLFVLYGPAIAACDIYVGEKCFILYAMPRRIPVKSALFWFCLRDIQKRWMGRGGGDLNALWNLIMILCFHSFTQHLLCVAKE